MAQANVFAMKESGLNAFLFSEVGTELNGSGLTILSVLARLGQDPWAEAARWAGLPKAIVVEGLTASILRMPLNPQDLSEAGATAARLTLLLPSQSQATEAAAAPPGRIAPKWIGLALLLCTLAVGLGANYMILRPHSQPPAAGQTVAPVPPG